MITAALPARADYAAPAAQGRCGCAAGFGPDCRRTLLSTLRRASAIKSSRSSMEQGMLWIVNGYGEDLVPEVDAAESLDESRRFGRQIGRTFGKAGNPGCGIVQPLPIQASPPRQRRPRMLCSCVSSDPNSSAVPDHPILYWPTGSLRILKLDFDEIELHRTIWRETR